MFGEKWTSDAIPDQSGRLAVITGATSGIGLETARMLAEKGAAVVLAVRNVEKGETVANAIRDRRPGAEVRVEALDLASLASVRAFAERISGGEQRLDLLINNAGVMMTPFARTADGFELQFGTNHLGHFALTALLFDRLASTPHSRVVTVSSLAHRAGRPDLEDLNWAKRPYNKTQAYADSKLANLYFTYELASRLEAADYLTLATAAHPGFTATNLQQHTVYRYLNPIVGQKPERGALPTLRAAVDPEATYGDYYGPDGVLEMGGHPKKVASSRTSHQRETASRLWELSEEMTGVAFRVGG